MELGVFEGRAAYLDALRTVLLQACAQQSREVFWVDENFAEWPLSEPAVLDALTQWVRRPRRLHMMALQYEDLRRRHPRFMKWRTTFDHCIEARAYEPEAMSGSKLVSALFVAGGEQAISLRLFDNQMWRGAVSVDAGDTLRTGEWFDALTQRSDISFAPTTFGL